MKSTKKIIISVFIVISLVTTVICYHFIYNFAVVIPGEVYRSREFSKHCFESVIKKYGIKSVINLRGYHPKAPWYQHEIAATKTLKIVHYDVKVSGYILPSLKRLRRLIQVLIEVKQPILIHCESGVDRTSLAAIIALILKKQESFSKLEKQVSWHYFVFNKNSVGQQVLDLYKSWLEKNNLQHSKNHFLEWVNNVYKK